MRGQLFGIDLLFAIILFLIVFTFLSNLRSDVRVEESEFNHLSLQARLASSYLLNSEGEPESWTPSNVTALGIASNRGVINPEKLRQFINLSTASQSTTLDLLGLEGLTFYFNVSYPNGSVVTLSGSYFNGSAVIGQDFNASHAASAITVAVLNNSVVHMQLKVGES